MNSIFTGVELAPRDPILGLNEQFNADTRTNKVNLGVGVYSDDNGKLPLLKAVHQAELELVQKGSARGYLPIEGIPGYNKGAQTLLFGANSELINSGRALTAQSLGGTGALKLGADFLKSLVPHAKVLISNPSWENHRALFERAGFEVESYPYYDSATNTLDINGMVNELKNAQKDTIIILHACCHNPTGLDPDPSQWQQIIETIKERELIPFLDIAYQGFGDGLDADASIVREFGKADITFLVSSSFSKSFSLYGERVGALTLVSSSQDESTRVLSQLKRVIRTNYSNPPTHGASIVARILNDNRLFEMWEKELAEMRVRIKNMREQLVSRLAEAGVQRKFDFILEQRGMFSYSGLNSKQVEDLQKDHAIYAVNTGRICVAALNSNNIDYVARAIAEVLTKA